jgi:hypothetical protein
VIGYDIMATTGDDLKKIANARLLSAETLIAAGDWHGAAYMLPYALECALKAVVCKTLHLQVYPDKDKSKTEIRTFFTTHLFDQLLVVSGLQDIYHPSVGGIPYKYWSDFTIEYPGRWVEMRYNLERMEQFDEKKIKELYLKLKDKTNGIFTIIEENKRW